MKTKEIEAYLEFAKTVSFMSHAKRLKVGAVIAKDGGDIISYGYNGTPSGYDNVCEVLDYEVDTNGRLVTRPEVIHAELNAIIKAAKSGKSCDGAWLFLTHKPCDLCAAHVAQSGIKTIVYSNVYASASHGNTNSAEIFKCSGIEMYQWGR